MVETDSFNLCDNNLADLQYILLYTLKLLSNSAKSQKENKYK